MDDIDSPLRVTPRPRVLFYDNSPENSDNSSFEASHTMSPVKSTVTAMSPCSPPYRKVRALKLFDTPSTPNTIIQKSAFERAKVPPKNIFQRTIDSDYHERPIAYKLFNKVLDDVETTANVNPFTPDSDIMYKNKKRSRTAALQENNTSATKSPSQVKSVRRRPVSSYFSSYTEDEEEETTQVQAPKRLALQDTNISRYRKEFVEIELIGSGEFGQVFRCKNRLDGTEYAVKKSKRPVAGSSYEQTALNEVWAHAVLGKHDNVVRYYSAWAEDNHMLIQNEYCNGGSLQTVLEKRYLSESELRTLLTHIANGLKYIHSNDLCHMDIKSGNIFLSKVPKKISCEDSFSDGCDPDGDLVIYKIGDLGHVTSVRNPQIEDGDCRYLSKEALNLDSTHLLKADMFSLGMTLYEAGGGGPLPKNGTEWHKLRQGDVPDLKGLSRDFNDLIKLLMHPDPAKRPSSTQIFEHPVLCPSEIKSKTQLTHELIMERKKNEELMKQLRKMTSHELNVERKRNAELCKKLHEANLKLKALQSPDTPRNRKGERTSPLSTDRKLRSSTCKYMRSGRSSKRSIACRDQNLNSYSNMSYLR